MTDEELIKGIAAKDHTALKELVDRYQFMVLNLSNSIIGNRDDAEEVTQDVFFQVYKSAHQFRGDANLSTWLHRITVNKSLSFLRNNKKHAQTLSTDIEYEDGNKIEFGSSDEYKPDELILKNEQKKLLNRALNSLPDNQRVAFVLHKTRDLQYKEIAKIMKRSVSSVESLIHRAKLNLQKELLDFFEKNND
ncbi:sigma-70 family RNA polymerase sigma factor [bacterium]|nr:sigma-70 family RNA polymerase sigma factor [bacterium]